MAEFDVAVVGGGPAGMVAGQTVAEGSEKDVVVLEAGVPREERDEKGPDSTDAAGFLNYWGPLAGVEQSLFDGQVERELKGACFHGPNVSGRVSERVRNFEEIFFDSFDAKYIQMGQISGSFGITFDRVGMDDKLRKMAETAGIQYVTNARVRSVDTTAENNVRHRLEIVGHDDVSAEYLVLADGPKRQVTKGALAQFIEPARIKRLNDQNHVASQKYFKFPPELYADIKDHINVYWGYIPGDEAYPWIFPNDNGIVRVGLTKPLGVTLDEFDAPERYELIHKEDERYPSDGKVIERFLTHEFGSEYDVTDFELVTDRGKQRGTERYLISSAAPIESPTRVNTVIVGGAMGATSAFHEGGYHTALATGRIAGELIADDDIEQYNKEWKQQIGGEVAANLIFSDIASVVTNITGPVFWDIGLGLLLKDSFSPIRDPAKRAVKRGYSYFKDKRMAGNSWVEISEDEYTIPFNRDSP